MEQQVVQQDNRAPAVHDGLGITSFILGILWVFGVGSILSVIFAHISMHQAKLANRHNSGLTIAGLVLGYLGIAGLVFWIIFWIVAAVAASSPSCYNSYYGC